MILIITLIFSSLSFAASNIKCNPQYDALSIPHQEVPSIEEFYYCFGYFHAKDRAWEMDYFRRVGQGRNAEIYGYSHLKSDLMMRFLDLAGMASKLWESMPADKKNLLEHYARGANVGFASGRKAQEFIDLDYAPEEWKPEHTLLILLLQSFDQTKKTFIRDHEEEQNKEKWKSKAPTLFDEDNMPWANSILKEGEYVKAKIPEEVTNSSSENWKLWSQFPSVFGEESGSNSWVVNSKKSKNGFAMLANDPHLDLKTPMFWYWIHLKTPKVNLIGASVPGVPVIVSGTNGKVAWGITNAYINTADAVYVKNLPEDFVETVRPVVKVKFFFLKLPFFFKSFEKTKNGYHILPLETESDKKVILKWSGFKVNIDDILPMFDLMKAGNVTQMDEILKKIGLPAWNFVFADTEGHIGYRVVGKIYRHLTKIPFGIPTKEMTDIEKDEFLDPMERPHVLKPARGYVYTANNRHWPKDSKFYGGRGYSYSFRGFRIDELLQSQQDLEKFKKIQCDRQVVDARFFVEKIVQYVNVPELNSWNFMARDVVLAPAIYRRLMDLMMENWSLNEYALYKFLDNLTADQKEELNDLYRQSLKDIRGKNWSEFHRLSFPHLSKNEKWTFSPEIAGVGDNHSVDPGTATWNEDKMVYEQVSGASMRMIITMKAIPEIELSLPGVNRYYTSPKTFQPWEDWRNCKYSKVTFE